MENCDTYHSTNLIKQLFIKVILIILLQIPFGESRMYCLLSYRKRRNRIIKTENCGRRFAYAFT